MARFRNVDLTGSYNHSGWPGGRAKQKTTSWHSSIQEAWPAGPRGKQSIQGIPFQIGAGKGRGTGFVALGRGARSIRIPLKGRADYICVLHFCDVKQGAAAGSRIADYTIELENGGKYTQPIRE